MPAMNGREMVAKIHALKPDIPVLYITSYTDLAAAHHGFVETAANLLRKPFNSQALLRAVEEILTKAEQENHCMMAAGIAGLHPRPDGTL